jgi:23S rRNA pseudouridine1911/1915/1917 synthase
LNSQYKVSTDQAKQRLDKFLSEQFERPRNQVQLDIAAGLVRIDGAVATQAGVRLRAEQVVEYVPPEPITTTLLPEAIPLDIVFEDEHLLVLNKPAGLVVHPAPGHSGGTVANALLAHCGPSLAGVGGEGRWGIVHRLDALTSGLMLAAKTQPAYERLVAMLAQRAVHRLYLGLAQGHFMETRGVIELPMGRRRSQRTLMGVIDPRRAARWGVTGKPARTDWELILQGDGVGLLGLSLHSGRTHQIRVHLQAIGRPIYGDPEYGRTIARTLHTLPQALRKPLSAVWPKRQLLHAGRLTLQHPLEEARTLNFTCPMPADFRRVVELFWPAELLDEHLEKWMTQPLATEDAETEPPAQGGS